MFCFIFIFTTIFISNSFFVFFFFLFLGIAGIPSYFELFSYGAEKKRMSNNLDLYTFKVQQINTNNNFSTNTNITTLNITNSGNLFPCPKPPQIGHFVCNSYDTDSGHYYGKYIPIKAGEVLLSVYLNTLVPGT